MNLHTLIFTENACYKAGRKISPKGIMVHSTGANNPWLKRYVGPNDGLLGRNTGNNHWNQPMSENVCVHAFIGKLADGSIATYQTLPWNHRGWHCGRSGNDTHISFEICEDGLTDKAYFDKVYKEAVELCASLCKMYELTEKDIICHSEGNKLGIASNHADVMHWFPKHGKSMDTFRADVKKAIANSTTTPADKPAEEAPHEPNITLKFKTGDIVMFNGGKNYISANSSTGSTVKASKAKITSVYKTGDHPYHCRAIDNTGKYISGVYGWVDESDLSAIEAAKPSEPAAPATPATIKKWDVVSIAKNATYYSGADIPDWVVAKHWIVAENPVGNRVVINKSVDGKHAINSPVHSKFLTVVKAYEPWTPKVGDIVDYAGNKHYANANATSGTSCKGGRAKITNIYQLGKSKHPYHIVREPGNGATVWGWVDEGSFTKA